MRCCVRTAVPFRAQFPIHGSLQFNFRSIFSDMCWQEVVIGVRRIIKVLNPIQIVLENVQRFVRRIGIGRPKESVFVSLDSNLILWTVARCAHISPTPLPCCLRWRCPRLPLAWGDMSFCWHWRQRRSERPRTFDRSSDSCRLRRRRKGAGVACKGGERAVGESKRKGREGLRERERERDREKKRERERERVQGSRGNR
jgi:hypothetical protein